MTKTQANIIIALLSCLLFVAGAHVVLTFVTTVLPTVTQFTAAGPYSASYSEEPQLLPTITLPDEVAVDEEFDLVMQTSNPHTKAVPLGHIDIESSLIKGFRVLSVTPSAVHTPDHYSYQRWSFTKAVAPGESQTVTFRLRAIQAGNYAGDIDFCNLNEDCTTKQAIVHVANVGPLESKKKDSKQ